MAQALVWSDWTSLNEATEKTLFCTDMAGLIAMQTRGEEIPPGRKTTIGLRFQEAGANLGMDFTEAELHPPKASITSKVQAEGQKKEETKELTQEQQQSADFAKWTSMKSYSPGWEELGIKYGWLEYKNADKTDEDKKEEGAGDE